MRDNMKDLEILYEDNHLIAVNKKISDIVQADKSGDVSLEEKVKAYIKEKYGKPGEVFLGCPHRIDRPVSGVVLFAKTSKALTRLNKMFQEHDEEIVKTYWAIVGNLPEETEGTLTHYMVRDGAKNKSYAYNQPKNGAKKAVLKYRLVSHQGRLEIRLPPLERERRNQPARPLPEPDSPRETGTDNHHGHAAARGHIVEVFP